MAARKVSPADRLRAALTARGLSVAEAARRLGVRRESVSQYVTGAREPSLDWLHAAAVGLEIDPAELDDRLASASPN